MASPQRWEDTTKSQHQGTSHLSICNNLPRRLLTRLALRTSARLYRREGPTYFRISQHLMVKKGPHVHLTEAATLQFVAAHTFIPVPRVHCAFVHKNTAYLVLQRLPGVSAAKAWPTLTPAQRAAACDELRARVAELRALPPPTSGGISSCVGGSLRDSRIPRSRPRFGPFDNARAFHLWLREGLQPAATPKPDNVSDGEWRDLVEMAALQDAPWPAPVFTHGDLNPFNILVSEGRVSGIIDWEFAGWYPYYWESAAAWYGNETRKAWQKTLPEFLDMYLKELQMDVTRQKWYGDF